MNFRDDPLAAAVAVVGPVPILPDDATVTLLGSGEHAKHLKNEESKEAARRGREAEREAGSSFARRLIYL